ncbi:MAG: hypothetical protein HYR56_13695 [Acidobacteria bacterium]|nr:hypothetical protein [Acidobacteriota bacterium]MBI3422621.1 hypothetical protein [Acidobacteriota bacterium]
MIKLTNIRRFCVLIVQASLLAAWLPLFAAAGQSALERDNTGQLSRTDDGPTWPLDATQAEIETANAGKDSATDAGLKLFGCLADAVLAPPALRYSAFHFTTRWQQQQSGFALLRGRAPPLSTIHSNHISA